MIQITTVSPPQFRGERIAGDRPPGSGIDRPRPVQNASGYG